MCGFRPCLGVLAAAVLSLAVMDAAAAELRVRVTNLESNAGDVHVAVYKTPEAFPKKDGMVAEKSVSIANGAATATFPGLEPGLYAVAIYHDENNNNEFDQVIFGIPLETYAFSNGAVANFGPPDFSEAAFQVRAPATEIVIRIEY